MKKKGKNIIIVILLLIVLGIICYLLYDKGLLMNLPKIDNPETKKTTKKELEDITDTTLVKDLHKEVTTNDNLMGLYYKSRITSEKKDDFRFIKYNVKNYIDEENIDITSLKCGSEINSDTTTNINKERINEYINKKYFTNIKYDLPISETISDDNLFVGPYHLISSKDNWSVVCLASSVAEEYISNKLIKAEKDDKYIYIYDKAVYCTVDGGLSYCATAIDENIDNAILDCSSYGDNSIDEKCPSKDSEESYAKALSEYAIKNYEKKLNTYKHTFKKIDGKYYWISSEIKE